MAHHEEDVPTSTIAIVGIASAIVLFALIVAIQAWFYQEMKKEQESKIVNQRYEPLADVQTRQMN